MGVKLGRCEWLRLPGPNEACFYLRRYQMLKCAVGGSATFNVNQAAAFQFGAVILRQNPSGEVADHYPTSRAPRGCTTASCLCVACAPARPTWVGVKLAFSLSPAEAFSAPTLPRECGMASLFLFGLVWFFVLFFLACLSWCGFVFWLVCFGVVF